LIEIGSKTAEKNSAQTNKQTDKPTDTMKIMVTWNKKYLEIYEAGHSLIHYIHVYKLCLVLVR